MRCNYPEIKIWNSKIIENIVKNKLMTRNDDLPIAIKRIK